MVEGSRTPLRLSVLLILCVLVYEGLLLRRWGGTCTFGDTAESEVPRRGLHPVVLRLAHVRLSGLLSSDILLTSTVLTNRDALMEEYVRLMQNMLRTTSTIKKRAKSVYHSKNLGTIKNRKQEKQQTPKEDSNGEIILRILRMRCVFSTEACGGWTNSIR
jgi:hypothetical protein